MVETGAASDVESEPKVDACTSPSLHDRVSPVLMRRVSDPEAYLAPHATSSFLKPPPFPSIAWWTSTLLNSVAPAIDGLKLLRRMILYMPHATFTWCRQHWGNNLGCL